nr:peptidase S41 [Pseudomonas sp.]
MLQLRRYARPSTLMLAMLLGMHGSVWAQQPPADLVLPPEALEGSVNKAPLPLEELRTFVEVLDRIKAAYVEPVDDKTLLENAIKGMLSNL